MMKLRTNNTHGCELRKMSPSRVNISPPLLNSESPFYCIRFCQQSFVQRFIKIINKKESFQAP